MPNDQTARCSMLPYTTKKWTNHARIKTNICSHFRHLTHLSSNDQFLCVPDNKMREKLYACSLATAAEKKIRHGRHRKKKTIVIIISNQLKGISEC